MKSTNHLDSNGKELYLTALMSPNDCISGLRHFQLLWKMLTALKTNMQMSRSRLHGSPLCQSHGYSSPVFACALHPWLAAAAPCAAAPDGAFCHPPWGSGPGLVNFSREKSNITAQQRESCSPCSFTTLEQVFLCCCFIRHPITSCINLSHLTAGKCAFWLWLVCKIPTGEITLWYFSLFSDLIPFNLKTTLDWSTNSALFSLSADTQINSHQTTLTHAK